MCTTFANLNCLLYVFRSEALYLAEDPSPPACEPYELHQPRVHLNGEFPCTIKMAAY